MTATPNNDDDLPYMITQAKVKGPFTEGPARCPSSLLERV